MVFDDNNWPNVSAVIQVDAVELDVLSHLVTTCLGFFSSQLKILLDQVDEAVGDFDECIRLRPDSALAQAQKCFALVSIDLKINTDHLTLFRLFGYDLEM